MPNRLSYRSTPSLVVGRWLVQVEPISSTPSKALVFQSLESTSLSKSVRFKVDSTCAPAPYVVGFSEDGGHRVLGSNAVALSTMCPACVFVDPRAILGVPVHAVRVQVDTR